MKLFFRLLFGRLAGTVISCYFRKMSSESVLEKYFLDPCQMEEKYWIPSLLDEVEKPGEYYQSWKRVLVERNSEQIKNSQVTRFEFYTTGVIETVFELCHLLKQPPEVRYLTVDIYDRFMINHTEEIMEALDNRFDSRWMRIKARLEEQYILRILTCIQLASKYSSNAKSITTSKMLSVLQYLNYNYSKSSVLSSELRVYSTLGCNMPTVTPLTFVEMFIEGLPDDIIHTLLSDFVELCVYVLDAAFWQHSRIYSKYQTMITGTMNTTLFIKQQFLSIKGDHMFLAGAVIRAASIAHDPTERTADEITRYISMTTQYPQYEIKLLSTLIFETILATDS